MNTGKISARYAKALYKFAEERKQEEKVYQEMKLVSHCFATIAELKEAMQNPTISKETKKALLITAAGTETTPEYNRFVDLVIEQRREEYFHGISLVYQDYYRKEKDIVISQLISATPLSDKEMGRIKDAVQSVTTGQVDFETSVDPDLIGGFVLNVETYQLDASVKRQLKAIKHTLLHSNSTN